MNRNIAVVVALLFTTVMLSQKSLNEYKFIVVPKKYSFLKSADKYNLNSLTRFLFKKEGFVVYYDDELFPAEYVNNPCLGLRADLENDSGMFSTRLKITLTNCANEIVLVSEEGKSKEKDYKNAYHAALRNAFKSVSALNYKYQPKEVQTLVNREVPKVTVPVVATEGKTIEEKMPVGQEIAEVKEAVKKVDAASFAKMVLYAQPIDNGFQLVDTTPQVIMKIFATSIPEVYLAKNDFFNGMLQKKDGEWYIEAVEQGKVVRQKLNIKF